MTTVDHWIIFVLLALIGGNMVREAFEEDEENARENADFDWEAHASARRGLQHRRIRRRRQFRIHAAEHLISVIIIGITTGLFSCSRSVYRSRVRLALAEARTDRGWRRAYSDRRESITGTSRIPRIIIANQIYNKYTNYSKSP